jgi:hypothetical protein
MSDNKETKPDLLISTYGNVAPAAKFGVGAKNLDEIKQATDAQRAQRPGEYDRKR